MAQIESAQAGGANADARTAKGADAKRSHVLRGILFAGIGGTCWGFSGTCTQALTSDYGIPVSWIICMRLTGAAILFMTVCLTKERKKLRRVFKYPRSILQILIFAIFGLLLTQIAYLSAIAHTSAGTGTVLERLGLLFIMAYVCLRDKRLPMPRELLGLLFALAGVLLIATHGNLGALAIPLVGLLWGLTAAFSQACYTVLPAKPLATWGSFIVTGLAMTFAAVASVTFIRPWTLGVQVTPEVAAISFVMITVGTFGAYFCYLQGVKEAGSMRAGLVGCVEPISAIVFSAVWLGTSITVFDAIGTVLIIVMVALTVQRDKP